MTFGGGPKYGTRPLTGAAATCKDHQSVCRIYNKCLSANNAPATRCVYDMGMKSLRVARDLVKSGAIANGGFNWSADGCSGPLPNSMHDACLRHDFGWRNWKGLSKSRKRAKGYTNANFRSDMQSICGGYKNGMARATCNVKIGPAMRVVNSGKYNPDENVHSGQPYGV